MPDDLAAQYCNFAEECLEKADSSTDEINRACWIKMAQDWLKLAHKIEATAGYASAG
jgi:hypothetical protein